MMAFGEESSVVRRRTRGINYSSIAEIDDLWRIILSRSPPAAVAKYAIGGEIEAKDGERWRQNETGRETETERDRDRET